MLVPSVLAGWRGLSERVARCVHIVVDKDQDQQQLGGSLLVESGSNTLGQISERRVVLFVGHHFPLATNSCLAAQVAIG